MPPLYITEQNSIIRKTSDRLIVEKNKEVLLEVPCLKVDTVLIYGNVQVTTQALAEMLDHGIELAILSLSGQLRGQLTPPKAKNMPLRMRQYEMSRSEDFCLRTAREIVRAKIENQAEVLRRLRNNHPDVPRTTISALDRLADGGVERISSLQALLGVEGSAAGDYFEALATVVPRPFAFDGRNRRPPKDPFNALLSFGYVLVGNELQALLDAMGFDPYLGFYHQIEYGRPSLALDLLEEFRAAVVDRMSLTWLTRRVFQPDDFTRNPDGGVRLHRESLRRFFPLYEEQLTAPLDFGGETLTFRQLFRRQAERLAGTLIDGEPYQAFRL